MGEVVGNTNELLRGPLLPGILDEVTLDKITPKLSWRDFHNLSSVSRVWNHTIRSLRVPTETLVLTNYIRTPNFIALALYSMREEKCCEFPLPPELHRGIPIACQCVAVDGKIYLVGGWEDVTATSGTQVYVFDLVSERRWKECASMQKGRADFGCAIFGGKIYVCGGTLSGSIVYGAEVYDPTSDTWSPIQPMKSLRHEHHVAILGEELVVYGGKVLNPNQFDWTAQQVLDPDEHIGFGNYVEVANTLEFYHPLKDEWRVVEYSLPSGLAFTAQGKFHSLSSLGVDIYDVDKKSWSQLHSCSFPVLPEDTNLIETSVVAVVDDQLIAVVERDAQPLADIYQSKWLNRFDEVVGWEYSPIPCFLFPCEGFPDGSYTNSFLCTIQLRSDIWGMLQSWPLKRSLGRSIFFSDQD